MSVEKIISEWKKKSFKPIYWLEGEESYFIDKVMNYAEHNILSESEASFNLTIFYGRDTKWVEVVNACKRFPMFADRQVVLLKEAQYMKDIANLENYFENPQPSTVLVIGYKNKKLDARTKFSKIVKQKGEILSTKKFYDNQLPDFVNQLVQQKELSINPKATLLLTEHIGNDLSRIDNELSKLLINLDGRKSITEDDIEKYIGISKDYNVTELQKAIVAKDMAKVIRIIQYIEKDPSSIPIQLILPSLYNFFSKVLMVYGVRGDERTIGSAIGVNPFFVKEYLQAAQQYSQQQVEVIILQLHQYNLRSVGVDNPNTTTSASLLKEMVVKLCVS